MIEAVQQHQPLIEQPLRLRIAGGDAMVMGAEAGHRADRGGALGGVLMVLRRGGAGRPEHQRQDDDNDGSEHGRTPVVGAGLQTGP